MVVKSASRHNRPSKNTSKKKPNKSVHKTTSKSTKRAEKTTPTYTITDRIFSVLSFADGLYSIMGNTSDTKLTDDEVAYNVGRLKEYLIELDAAAGSGLNVGRVVGWVLTKDTPANLDLEHDNVRIAVYIVAGITPTLIRLLHVHVENSSYCGIVADDGLAPRNEVEKQLASQECTQLLNSFRSTQPSDVESNSQQVNSAPL